MSNSTQSFAKVVINSTKRKRSESPSSPLLNTPSPIRVDHGPAGYDYNTSKTGLSQFDPESQRWTNRKRSSKTIAKSKSTVASRPDPLFDDKMPPSVFNSIGCQTILSQTVLEENALIAHYIDLANAERKRFNKERREKNKFAKLLEKESKVTDVLTDSITSCLQICQDGIKQVHELDRVFPKCSFTGQLTQSEVNVKILLDSEKNSKSIGALQSVVQSILTETSKTMDKFIELKELSPPNIQTTQFMPATPTLSKKSSSLLSQILAARPDPSESDIAIRHSSRLPMRPSLHGVRSSSKVFNSQISRFLSKEVIELENVNPTANIEIKVPVTPKRSDVQGPSSKLLIPNFAQNRRVQETNPKLQETNSKDINFETFQISQESVKIEAPKSLPISQKVKVEASTSDSIKDLELDEFSDEWLDSSLNSEWIDFVKIKEEAKSDPDHGAN